MKKGLFIVVDGIESIEPKTKLFVFALEKIAGNVKTGAVQEKTLVATPGKNDVVYRAGRNVKNVTIRETALLNAYEVINSKRIIFMKSAVDQLKEPAVKTP